MLTQAMILCGGLGTRLGALTATTPKPLLAVSGRPFLDVLLLELARHGFEHVVLLAAFESAQIHAYAADSDIARRFGLRLEVAIEPDRAGTGGALYHARALAEPAFLLLNGDSWLDVNLLALVDMMHAPDCDVALALRALDDASRFGVVEVASGGRVARFLERPERPGPGHVNAGIYLMRRSLLDRIEPVCSLERDVLPKLAAQGRVRALARSGYFIDIGIPETYAAAQTEIPKQQKRRAVFLDRDGVINHDEGYVGSIERFRWIDGAREAIRKFNDNGDLVFVVTNQAGVARGFYEEADVIRLHAYIQSELRKTGAHIDDFRYCPYHPNGTVEQYRKASAWRKPAPGMLLDLASHWSIDLGRSLLIGDKGGDLEAAAAAAIEGHLFPGGNLAEFVSDRAFVS